MQVFILNISEYIILQEISLAKGVDQSITLCSLEFKPHQVFEERQEKLEINRLS